MDNFDVHEWNKKRYLGKLNENQSHLEFLSKYLEKMHPELRFDVRFGERIDVYGSQQDLYDFGTKMHGKKFGDEYEVFHTDDEDRGEIVRIVKSSSINEAIISEAYEPKHFDICPGAQALRDKVVAGEFGSTEEFDLDKWTKLHDALFGLEKKVLRDKEAEDSDVKLAEKLRSEIINLSRDINIPAEAIGYLKGHVDKIRDISDYSALTEEDRFAGSDPRGGSTIKGTGFDWKRKEKKSLPLKLQWQGDFPSQQEVDDAFSSWQRETHYLASKPVEKWDEYDLSNFNAISRKGGKIQ